MTYPQALRASQTHPLTCPECDHRPAHYTADDQYVPAYTVARCPTGHRLLDLAWSLLPR